MAAVKETIEDVKKLEADKYKYGFTTDVEQEFSPKGLDEETVRYISAKKGEPAWMTEWRLKALERFFQMKEPDWAKVKYPPIDFQDIYYYAEPKSGAKYDSIDDVPEEILADFEKLGIPLKEQEVLLGVKGSENRVAVDAVFDSVSVVTTFKKELAKAGVIFCSISEALRDHPELVRKYLGSVVPASDNYFATLNTAVFSDGSFVYVPPGVRCPMELSTYFRMNAEGTGQFERTLIIADKGAYVSYLEGCTAPMRDENGKGGVYNFVTKRGDCRGKNSKISWTQVETGSAITWKYPSCILKGENSRGEFYSIAVTNGHQQADTGTKMIHLGKGSTSRIISKGISAGRSDQTYRGLVSIHAKAEGARNFTQCDSLLIGDQCGAHTVPYIECKTPKAVLEHEATTTRLSEDQLFYARQRGLDEEAATALLVNGFVREVLQELPMEFAVEAQNLLKVSLEGSVG